ncbi:DMT family transporter [Methylovirgula sp. 4M-Z18]|nr:DMT family transporter [Methylovirgula sp. 4M-Z18]
MLFDRFAPFLFLVLWSTGWIAARAITPYADPLTFLAWRYVLAAAALVIFAVFSGAIWPRRAADWGHGFVSGIMIHAIYLGGVWWAVRHGVPATISALLAAIQPILTTILAPYIAKERIRPLQGLGVALGFCGLLIVLSPKLAGVAPGTLAQVAWPLVVNALCMVSVTLGAFYQKRFIPTGDLRTVTVLQYIGAFSVTLPAAFLLEDMHVTWNAPVIATMVWSVFGLSIGAIVLYFMLIRHGAVSRPAQLIFLVPPTAAVQAWVLFGESLSLLQLGGMAVTALGVALASRKS